MALEVRRCLDHVVRSDHPSDAPARHGIGLGDAVDDDALVGQVGHERRHRGELVRSVGEVFVDLVGDDPDAVFDRPLSDRLDGGRRIHGTRRVVGADEEQRLRSPCTDLLELVDRDLEAALGVRVDDHRYAAGQRDRLGIRRPVRGRADDLVARIAQGGERGVHRMLATVRDEHLRPQAVEPGVALGLVRDRLFQLGKATSWRVPVVAHLGTGGDRGIDDVLRGREVGLTRAEPDDVLPLGLQGLGLGVDRQGGRRGDCSESFGGSFHNRQACHSDRPLPTRFPVVEHPERCRCTGARAGQLHRCDVRTVKSRWHSDTDRPCLRAVTTVDAATAITIPADLLPADGRFGCGPSKVRDEQVRPWRPERPEPAPQPVRRTLEGPHPNRPSAGSRSAGMVMAVAASTVVTATTVADGCEECNRGFTHPDVAAMSSPARAPVHRHRWGCCSSDREARWERGSAVAGLGTVKRTPNDSLQCTASATLAVDAKAKALQAEGENVSASAPVNPTSRPRSHRRCRGQRVLRVNNHRYTPAGGFPALREAIAVKTKRDSGSTDGVARCSSRTVASMRCTPRSPPCAIRATR